MSSDASKRAKRQPRGMPGNAGQFRPNQKPAVPTVNRKTFPHKLTDSKLFDNEAAFDALVNSTHTANRITCRQDYPRLLADIGTKRDSCRSARGRSF